MSGSRPDVDQMITLGFFGKLRLALVAMVALSKNIVDPWAQQAFQWAMDSWGIGRVTRRAHHTPEGRRLLAERPMLRLDLAALAALPEGTLGRFLADWFRTWSIAPFTPRRTPDGALEYFVDRLFFTHDVWHALVGLGTDLRNELRFLGVLLSQYHSGSAVLALAFGWFKVPAQDGWKAFFVVPLEVWRFYRWGQTCKELCFVPWEAYLDQPLEQLRADFLANDRPRIGEWQSWPTARIVLPPQVTTPRPLDEGLTAS
ncbi:MAG: Coq4 family protein [Myxococcales bacterium]|nr:Coq4 family protein [Myxococcales bacterium]